MKAIQLGSYVSGPQDLTVIDVPDPKASADQYLIQIRACAANFFDLLQIRGKYQHQPPFPWIGGSEFSGIVIKTPESSKNSFKVGDKVFGTGQGAFATKIAVDEANLRHVPSGWTFQESAALYLTGPTSYAAMVLRARLQPGEYALVHGAAGGVGLSAAQIAKAHGAVVIATATTQRNIEICKQFGADHVIDYMTTPDWEKSVMEITRGHGADVVFDPVGVINQSSRCAAWGGRLVTIGFVGGIIESVKVNRVLLKNISVVGLHWGPYAQMEPRTVEEVWSRLFDLIAKGKYKPTTFRDNVELSGLGEVQKGLKLLEDKAVWGKVVIPVPDETKARL